jgi:putative addiction module component (TIGR02574 family)
MPELMTRYGLDKLSDDEKRQLIGEIEESLPPDEEWDEWEKELITKRLDDMEKNPDAWVPWEDVRAKLMGGTP